jgi:hypothetical protein
MSEFERQAGESPRSWLSRLCRANTAGLPLAQQRLHIHFLADARRLVQHEQQKARWDRGK